MYYTIFAMSLIKKGGKDNARAVGCLSQLLNLKILPKAKIADCRVFSNFNKRKF